MKSARLSTRHRATVCRALLGLAFGLVVACGGEARQAKQPDEPVPFGDEPAGTGQTVKASSPEVQEGIDAIQKKDFAAAEASLLEAYKANPEDPQVCFYLGVTYEGLEDTESAVKYYREALELDPKLSEASVNLSGILLDVQNNPKSALKVVQAALKHAPKHPGLLLNQAFILEALQDWPAAVEAYAALVAVVKDKDQIWLGYAIALHEAGKNDAALEQLGHISADCKDLKVLAPAARLYGVLGAYDKCVSGFSHAIAVKKAPEFMVRRALCRKAAGDVDNAIADLQEALNLDAKYAPAHLEIGLIFKEQKKMAEARRALEDAMKFGAGTPIAEQAKKALEGVK
jgi:tetratricopeptide (TPR) repeat protein